MVSTNRCTTGCDYVPLTHHTSIRPPPWTPDDTGLKFHWCKRCGAMTVQKFNSSTGYGQITMLGSSAMALFRTDASPAEVFEYVSSEDFASNRSITESIFEGWLSTVGDLSASANTLIHRTARASGPDVMELPMKLLVSVFREAIRRSHSGAEVRCKVNDITPLVDLVRGVIRIGADPRHAAMLRFRAFESLDLLGQPALWGAVSAIDAELVEEMIDHKSLLERSRENTIEARKLVHSDGPPILEMEAKFLLEVFRHRGSFLPPTFASLLWGCLRDLRARFRHARGGIDELHRTYRQLQLLLEHQLGARGLEREPSLDRASRAFVDPRLSLVIRIRQLVPEITVYRDAHSHEPLAVFEAWNDLWVFLQRAHSR